MKKLLLAVLILAGCRHKSDILKTESGIVVGKQFTPDTRQTVMGIGTSSNGNFITTHYVGDKEKYTIVFKCSHGVIFPIDNINVYSKLKDGDTVNIKYYEILNSKDMVVDFDFVDANKLNH